MSLVDSLLLEPRTLDVWIALRTDGAQGAGTESDPYDGSTAATFDALMRALPGDTAIHLGRGVFETHGFSPNVAASWQPKSGQKIIGSGIDVTVLKLVNASVAGNPYWVIGGDYNHFLAAFEASDLTLDCNLDGQVVPGHTFPPVTCGAISLAGKHMRIRRIRAINFGTLTNLECFVLGSAGAHADNVAAGNESTDCVIEDCIVERPAINNGLVTCINMSAAENPSTGLMGFHRACAVRNCVIDCEYKLNPVPITGITFSGTTATATTLVPHGRAANDWVRVAGAMVNGSADNPFNGSFKIASATATTFQYNMASAPSAVPTGDIWLDRFPSHLVAVTNISKAGTGPFTITVTTATPHFRAPGNSVVVNQSVPAAFNGSFEVTEVPTPTQLRYVLASDPGTWSRTGLEFVGVAYQAISNDGGTAAVVEGNRIFNTRIGGPYHDTYTTKDLVVRNNYYRSVVTGPFQNLGVLFGFGVSSTSDLIPLVSLTASGSTATATTARAHGFAVNDRVIVLGATGPDADNYNSPAGGSFQITAVTPTTFQYQMPGSPGGPAQGGPGYATADADTFRQRLLQSLTYELENGVYVATARISDVYSGHGFAVGDAVKVSKATSQPDQAHNDLFNGYHEITAVPDPKTFQYELAGNPDPRGQSGSSPSGYYGRLWQAGRILIEGNVIELIPTSTTFGPPVAITFGFGKFVSPPLFRQVTIRRNVIRHVDNGSDPPNLPPGLGISASGCAHLIVEENVVDLDHPAPIAFAQCDKVRFFNNQTSSGIPIQAVNVTEANKGTPSDEWTADIEDALLLAF
jgi:hypothetical protein